MISHEPIVDLSYFPGCSLATTAKENNQSMKDVCLHLGYRLIELDDWNCCGSSSAHSINHDLAFHLACRNLSLAPPGRPLVVACPSCILRLRQAHHRLKSDAAARTDYQQRWGRPPNEELKIIHFFELLDGRHQRLPDGRLNDLKIAPYYGCMLAHPPELRHEKNYHGLMEKMLTSHGAVPINWSHASRCCGTFLSVARPDVAAPMVNGIMAAAVSSGAECIVTAMLVCYV